MEVTLSEQQKVKLLNSEDVFRIMQGVLLRENKIDQDKEHFWIIGLANNNKILFVELVSIGSVRATVVEPMNVFRVAILKNAVKVILVHNHPSGELTPSNDDKDVTDRLIQVGRIIDIEVVEHLIITTEEYYSFVDSDLFELLQDSMEWMPPFEIIQKIRKEEQEIRKEAVHMARIEGLEEGIDKGLAKGRMEMAKAMKKSGEPLDKIVEYTNLLKKEAESL